tara:strand:+ start:215 stop:820 length:606 start_codon:yes stop_codon:yes gene_type:complete
MKKIIVIDNHKAYNNKFCELIERRNYKVGYVFEHPQHALQYLRENYVEIVFCDIIMPEKNGLDLIKKIKKANPFCKIVFLSMYVDKKTISEELSGNIDGFFSTPYSDKEIKTAVSNSFLYLKTHTVKKDSSQLVDDEYLLNFRITEREKEIIHLILKQKSSIEIAEELFISKRTVETHRNNIISKLNVKNSVGIAVKLLQA